MVVSPELFIKRMELKWVERGQSVYQAQKDAWKVLCETLNDHAQREGNSKAKWSVIPLPTGVGKTEGVVSYCAELAVNSPETGVLIVTRFTEEADRIATSINQEAGREIAVTQHSKQTKQNKPTSDEVHGMQVLVITHTAYKMALAKAAMGQTEKMQDRYSLWKSGKRLIIIDEVLRVDEPLTVDYDELRLSRYSIPMHIEGRFPKEIAFIDSLLETFGQFIQRLVSEQKKALYFSSGDWKCSLLDVENFNSFLSSFAECGDVDIKDKFERTVIKVSCAYCRNVLSKLNEIAGLQGYCVKVEDKFQITAVSMLMPDEIPDAVILDATANQNIVYRLLGDFVELVDVPANVRDYSNVALNILYGIPVGKGGLAGFDKDIIRQVYEEHCSDVLIPDTLFCTHQFNREGLKQVVIGLDDNSLVHWGSIDGKNNWSTLSGMVICGLSYLGQINADNIGLCFDQWIQKGGWKYHLDSLVLGEDYDPISGQFYETADMDEMPIDYYREFEKSHIAVSVIQAINRVRCRNVTDGKGGCDQTNIYLFLDKKNGSQREYQEHLLKSIVEVMPNIQVSELELERVTECQLSNHEQVFIDILRSLEQGDHVAKDVMASSNSKGISVRTVKRFQKVIKEGDDSEFTRQVKEAGCTYISERGKYGKSVYRKA